jgi:hypothetical protein
MKKLIFIILLSCNFVKCQQKSEKQTPNNYISIVKVPKVNYSNDSLILVSSIKKDILEHKGGYNSKSFDIETKVIIDTIMYSPNNERIFFFVITEVENRKLYPKEMSEQEIEEASKYSKLSMNGFHYKGKGYIAYKRNDTIVNTQFYGITTASYENIESVRQRQRQIFFKEFSAVNETGYEFNINDKRFWDNKNFWDKMKRKLEEDKEFENMRLTNPENIYDPKN